MLFTFIHMNRNSYLQGCFMTKTKPISCASKLKALADPTRLAVLKALFSGPKYVNELSTLLNVEQSLLSHHLQVLRKVQLVEPIRDGKAVRYQLYSPPQTKKTMQVIQLGCCQLSFDESSDQEPHF